MQLGVAFSHLPSRFRASQPQATDANHQPTDLGNVLLPCYKYNFMWFNSGGGGGETSVGKKLKS